MNQAHRRGAAVKVFLAIGMLCVFALADAGAVWLDVPFVKQEQKGCGAAVISMLMRYWDGHLQGVSKSASDPQQIMKALYSEKAGGIYASDLQRYLRENGFQAFVFRGTWNDLEQHLKKGRPLVIALDEGSKGGALHYAIVAGIDTEQGVILLNDPARRKLSRFSRADFENSWGAMDHWTLLAVPNVR